YLNTLYYWVANDFSPASLYPKIDSIANVIRPFVYADPNKQYTSANFDFNIDNDLGNIPGLKDFIQTRYTSIIQQLVAFGYTDAGIINQAGVNAIHVYPNPIEDKITISNLDIEKNYLVSLFDITGKRIFSIQSSAKNQLTLNRENIASGIYIIEIKDQITAPQKIKIILR
ncbi:MAG: T9SS type A sorting domain-containing protein, partial [Ignavibacteria bacterium]|nr:T9SS type A sorting domain-containing protein [Ignavibacteria bacterium]